MQVALRVVLRVAIRYFERFKVLQEVFWKHHIMSITPISNNVLYGQDKRSFYDAFRFRHHLFCIIVSLIREDEQIPNCILS